MLVNNLVPGAILFTFPFFPFPKSITPPPPFPPKMEVNIKVLSCHMIQITDSKTNMPRSDREAEVSVCEKLDVETSRLSSKSSVES
jgi:hypothetical protein